GSSIVGTAARRVRRSVGMRELYLDIRREVDIEQRRIEADGGHEAKHVVQVRIDLRADDVARGDALLVGELEHDDDALADLVARERVEQHAARAEVADHADAIAALRRGDVDRDLDRKPLEATTLGHDARSISPPPDRAR